MGHALKVTLGQHSRAGRGGVNQDFHGAMLPGDALRRAKGIAVALADGIGSSPVGQEASAAAVRCFLDDYYATPDAWSVQRSAQRVLAATNAWLHGQTLRSPARFDKDRGHVCTFSALVLKGREVHLLHVGDSRIYRVHAQSLEQLTEDHRVRMSSHESFLGRALGVTANVEIDHRCLRAETGDVFLLATDGAYAHLDAAAVKDALARHGDDLDAAAEALVALAQARGSEDDATVQLLRIDALPEADPARLPLQREGLLPAPALAPRMRFEGFTIVRELHASARSHVHLAIDDATGQAVVLKTPSVDLAGDADYLDRFVLEEWVAHRLHSPHVLRPWRQERPRAHLYAAMEYVEGQTLAQWQVDHPCPDLDSVRALVTQVAKGLQAFHGKEMLHRDLRPDNVIVDRTGTAKIIDFASTHVAGLAEGTLQAEADRLVGTLQFSAPEYFLGQAGTVRSEVFSLAVLTYHLLTGALPYGLAASRVRTPSDLRRLHYQPVRHHRPELPDWLDAVLHKALHPDPAKRQEAVSEFVHDLAAPGAQFHRYRIPPLIERHPVLFWQVATAALAVVLLMMVTFRVTG